jgi:aromatic ring-cleaving dioxygenase
MTLRIKGYHAHVYFDASTLTEAKTLCEKAGEIFPVKVGRYHKTPVGPHPMWSCQLMFSAKKFSDVLPWLVQNRGALTVFVHTLTGDDIYDHTQGVIWLGESLPLNLSIFE